MRYDFNDTEMSADADDDAAGLIPALPDDVALHCLLRVPPQAHAQLQRVSRRWRDLVSNPRFYEDRKREGTAVQFLCTLEAIAPPAPSPSAADPVTAAEKPWKRSPQFGVSVFNVQQRSWARLPPIPELPHGLPLFCRMVAVNGKLVVLGGWHPTSFDTLQTVYIYNFATQAWAKGAPMPTARSFFACAAVGNYVFMAGGHDNAKTALTSGEAYDVAGDRWSPLPPMRCERDEATGAGLDGKFYVVGGYATSVQGQFARSAEVYDPATNAWATVEDMWAMEPPGGGAPATPAGPFAASSGKLYSFNGQTLCSYTPGTGVWSAVDALPDGEVNPVCVAAINESLLVTGPARGGDDPGYRTLVYKPAAKRCKSEWERIDRDAGVAHASYAIEI